MLLNLASDHSTEDNFRLISNCKVCFKPKGEKSKEMSRKTLIDYINIRLHNNQIFCWRHPKGFITWISRFFMHAVQSQHEFLKGISKNPDQAF